jgi:hypothetical protein
MLNRRQISAVAALLLLAATLVHRAHAASPNDLALHQNAAPPFRFVVFGDTRFTNPADTAAANPTIRHAMVRAIAGEHPAFIAISGDLVYVGENPNDWKVWDSETSAWHDAGIPIYPALGNHDLKGNQATALGNYFARFPDLQQHRYYSVRVANCLLLTLDSALDENAGPQGEWIARQLDRIPAGVKFVLFVMHHPPMTNSTDNAKGGGHSERAREQAFAAMLEQRQQHTSAHFVVFGGHVHNYERYAHGGVTYFVTGGGGATPYIVVRTPQDAYQNPGVNYHYLTVDVTKDTMTITMHRVDLNGGRENWTTPDKVTIGD